MSRYGGSYEHITNSVTAGVHINCPQLDINTVAAGGGSMLFFRNGLFVVGPESAGAHPGPACYLKGGPLTVTDANLVLGRLLPETFPKIFGPNEDQPLGVEVTRKKFNELTDTINAEIRGNRPEMTVEEVALGFLQVANLNMAKPIRALTDTRGFHTAAHNLASFGGAGGRECLPILTFLIDGFANREVQNTRATLRIHLESPVSLLTNTLPFYRRTELPLQMSSRRGRSRRPKSTIAQRQHTLRRGLQRFRRRLPTLSSPRALQKNRSRSRSSSTCGTRALTASS